MRLIDADELMARLRKDPLFGLIEPYGIESVIAAAPTIEAEPVRRGKWTRWYHREDDFSINCSLCFRPVVWPSLYCPQCGARMEVEE